MISSLKRAPIYLAVISWSLSLILFAGYHLTLAPPSASEPLYGRETPVQDDGVARPASCAPVAASDRCSYSAYLSRRLREDGYFESGPAGVWAVIRYRIAPDGRLLSSEVVESQGAPCDVASILEGVRRKAPYRSFSGERAVEVLELFWADGDHMSPGSLAEWLRLNGDDGRVLLPDHTCASQ